MLFLFNWCVCVCVFVWGFAATIFYHLGPNISGALKISLILADWGACWSRWGWKPHHSRNVCLWTCGAGWSGRKILGTTTSSRSASLPLSGLGGSFVVLASLCIPLYIDKNVGWKVISAPFQVSKVQHTMAVGIWLRCACCWERRSAKRFWDWISVAWLSKEIGWPSVALQMQDPLIPQLSSWNWNGFQLPAFDSQLGSVSFIPSICNWVRSATCKKQHNCFLGPTSRAAFSKQFWVRHVLLALRWWTLHPMMAGLSVWHWNGIWLRTSEFPTSASVWTQRWLTTSRKCWHWSWWRFVFFLWFWIRMTSHIIPQRLIWFCEESSDLSACFLGCGILFVVD